MFFRSVQGPDGCWNKPVVWNFTRSIIGDRPKCASLANTQVRKMYVRNMWTPPHFCQTFHHWAEFSQPDNTIIITWSEVLRSYLHLLFLTLSAIWILICLFFTRSIPSPVNSISRKKNLRSVRVYVSGCQLASGTLNLFRPSPLHFQLSQQAA